MPSKSDLIKERSAKLAKVGRRTLRRAWSEKKGDYDHLISVQGVISEHFGWNLGRLIDWAKGTGFDGVEIRAETIARYLDQPLPKDTVIGVHLSDKAHWTSLWSKDQTDPQRAFGSLDIAKAYLGYTNASGMVSSLSREIQMGSQIGARYFVFHASEIDYTSVITGQLQEDQPVIAAATSLIRELNCPDLVIENAPLHEAGAHDSQELIGLSRHLAHSVFALDTSHLQVYLFGRGLSEESALREETRKINAGDTITVKLVHLSESTRRESPPGHQDPRRLDFWQRRSLANELIVDDHLPVGHSIKRPWEIIRASGTKSITHELKAETFELLEQALLIQQAYLAGFEI